MNSKNPFPSEFPWPFGTIPADGGAAPNETSTGVNPDFARIDHSREYPIAAPADSNNPGSN